MGIDIETNLKYIKKLAQEREGDDWNFRFRLIQAVQNCSVCPISFHVFERLKDELWHEPNDVLDE